MDYKNQLNENQGNPKRQWKTFPFLLGKRGSLTNRTTVELKSPCMYISTKFDYFLALDDDNYNYTTYLNNSPSF